MNYKLKLALLLFVLGLLGILSMLTAEVNTAQLPPEVTEQFTPTELKLLTLVNPTVLLIIAIAVGVNLYRKVDLRVPLLERYVLKEETGAPVSGILTTGVGVGLVTGAVMYFVSSFYTNLYQEEFEQLGNNLQLPVLARFLYGGITEEILIRFGFMTLVVWVLYKITKRKNTAVYIAGIVVAALLFALAHLPIVFQAVSNPSPGLISYIIIGNTVGGLAFGWMYWKKGLEGAIISHMAAHAAVLAADLILK